MPELNAGDLLFFNMLNGPFQFFISDFDSGLKFFFRIFSDYEFVLIVFVVFLEFLNFCF